MDKSTNHLDGKICIICEKEKKEGFNLYNSFICIDCEKEIAQTEVGHPFYNYFVKQLKKISSPKILS